MNRACVLHVDDVQDDRFLFQHAAKQAGLALPLLSLESGERALAYMAGEGEYANRNEFPLPCIILLDVKMPGLGGFDVLQRIRQQPQFKDIVIIMFSGSQHDGDIEKAAALGANSFVTKPADCRALTKLVGAIQDYWLTFHEFGWNSNCRPKARKSLAT